MAKKNLRNGSTVLDSYELGTNKYSYRSDGVVLRQWRYNGRLQPATILHKNVSRSRWDEWKARNLYREATKGSTGSEST